MKTVHMGFSTVHWRFWNTFPPDKGGPQHSPYIRQDARLMESNRIILVRRKLSVFRGDKHVHT